MKHVQHSCVDEIEAVSLKVTPVRVAALKLFESAEKPLDAQFLIDHLHKKLAVDRVTVFRLLNTFVANRLLRKVEFGEGKARYELAGKNDHHHLICESCGTIVDVADTVIPDMEKELQKKYHFLIKSHSLEFFGLCKNCQK